MFRVRLRECLHDRDKIASIEHFVAMTGWSRNTLYQYMSGHREPNLSNLMRLRLGLTQFGTHDLSVDWLLGLSRQRYIHPEKKP
jgi:predicted transcriptional regulator